MMETGILLDCMNRPLREAAELAASFGVKKVQFYAAPLLFPSKNTEALRHIRTLLDDNGLGLSALCGELGGHGFERKEENRGKIHKMKEMVDFAFELGTEIITTHVGIITEGILSREVINDNIRSFLEEVGRYARRKGVFLAIETGPEPAAVLKRFLKTLDVDNIKVNFDPANLVMVQGEDPVVALGELKDYVIHVHAKDGIRKRICDPVRIYNTFAAGEDSPDEEGFVINDYFEEVPLGEGDVPLKEWVGRLSCFYSGPVIIEREAGDKISDIKKGVKYLKSLYNSEV